MTTQQPHRFDDSAGYERLIGRWSRAAGSVFLTWLAPPARASWLEVGCGTGAFTEMVLDTCAPAALIAIDPSQAQLEHAARQPVAMRADFRAADAQALPFANAAFDIVAAALVINFIPDRPKALAEMRRVVRPGGIVAGYVWDFAPERSPSGPFRLAMRQFGVNVAPLPGASASGLAALQALFVQTGFANIETRTIDVTMAYADFEDFWETQISHYSPTTKTINAMTAGERAQLKDSVRATVPVRADGAIEYAARANAIKAVAPA